MNTDDILCLLPLNALNSRVEPKRRLVSKGKCCKEFNKCCRFLIFMSVFQKSVEREECIHRDEIESLADDNGRATAEPDPHSSVFDSHTKCGPVTRIFPPWRRLSKMNK